MILCDKNIRRWNYQFYEMYFRNIFRASRLNAIDLFIDITNYTITNMNFEISNKLQLWNLAYY